MAEFTRLEMLDNSVDIHWGALPMELTELAEKHGCCVMGEMGWSGPIYHLVSLADADLYMLSRWEPRGRAN